MTVLDQRKERRTVKGRVGALVDRMRYCQVPECHCGHEREEMRTMLTAQFREALQDQREMSARAVRSLPAFGIIQDSGRCLI